MTVEAAISAEAVMVAEATAERVMRERSTTGTRRNGLGALWLAIAVVTILVAGNRSGRSQSLEEQTRRPPGTSSLDDDSEHLRHGDATRDTGTDSLDDDSMDLRGGPADANHTNSLDDGSLEGGPSTLR